MSQRETTDLRQTIEALRTLNDGVLLRERERLWATGNAEAASAVDDARHGISCTVRDLRRAEKESASDARWTDILALLRTWDSPVDPDNIREAAARTIERLTAALRDIEALKRSQGDELGDARTIARKALCQ